jgi:hypothetical protein
MCDKTFADIRFDHSETFPEDETMNVYEVVIDTNEISEYLVRMCTQPIKSNHRHPPTKEFRSLSS